MLLLPVVAFGRTTAACVPRPVNLHRTDYEDPPMLDVNSVTTAAVHCSHAAGESDAPQSEDKTGNQRKHSVNRKEFTTIIKVHVGGQCKRSLSIIWSQLEYSVNSP